MNYSERQYSAPQENNNGAISNNPTTLRKRVSRLCLTPNTLLLISTLLYFFPFFVGSFEYILPSGSRATLQYSLEVGMAVAIIIAILVFVAFVIPHRQIEFKVTQSSKIEANVLLITLVALFAYTIVDGSFILSDKSEMLANTGRLQLMFYVICTISFIFSFLVGFYRYKLLSAFSVVGLLFIVYAGHRSSLAIAVIGVAYIIYRNKPITRQFLKLSAVAFVLFMALSIYKSIYVAIKIGDWDFVVERISSENIGFSMLVGMEQFVTFAHLDFIVSSDFRLACSNAWMIPFSVIPFMDEVLGQLVDLGRCDYNAQVQPVFFSGYYGGVAANIWAEFFGYFGYFGFPIIVAILTASFWIIEYFIRRIQSPVLVAGLIVALINISFYIQRKELFGGFISAKRSVMIAILIFTTAWFLRKIASRKISI